MARSKPVLAAIVFAVAAGCDGPTQPHGSTLRTLELAEQMWMAHRPVTYSIRQARLCYCQEEATREMIVVASREGTPDNSEALTSITYAEDGQPVPEEFRGQARSVQMLFQYAREAIKDGAARVEIEYDLQWKYPRRIYIDRNRQTVDEEVLFQTSALAPYEPLMLRK